MKTYVIIKGQNLDGIEEVSITTDSEQAEEIAQDSKKHYPSAGILEDSLDIGGRLCGHGDYNIINHDIIDDLTIKCSECDTWVIISKVDGEAKLNVIDLNDRECPECEGELDIRKDNTLQCIECNGLIVDGSFIPNDLAEDIKDVKKGIELKKNNGALEEGKEL